MQSLNCQREAEVMRTADSLIIKWETIQRSLQKFLPAKRLKISCPVSGEKAQDAASNVMKLFSNRTGEPDENRVIKLGPPLRC